MIGLALFELIVFGIPIALFVVAVTGNRPSPERFAVANELSLDETTTAEITTVLSRTRRGRVQGATIGCISGLALGLVASAALDLVSPWSVAFSTTGGILVGSLVGIGFAQSGSRDVAGPTREASLAVRDVRAYRTRFGNLSLRVAVVAFLGAVALTLVATAHDTLVTLTAIGITAACTLGFLALASRLSIRVVERARDRVDPDHARVDDALRSSAVRAIQHATIGVLACAIGILGLVGINTQTYEAVKVDGHAVFVVPDGGSLIRVVEGGDVHTVVTQTTRMRIKWRDRDGTRHVTVRARPPATYLGSGTYIDNTVALSLGGLAVMLGWCGGLIEWSRAAKAWRRRGPFRRRRSVKVPTAGAIA